MGFHVDFLGGGLGASINIYKYISVRVFQVTSEMFSEYQDDADTIGDASSNTGTMTWVPEEVGIVRCDSERFGGTDKDGIFSASYLCPDPNFNLTT